MFKKAGIVVAAAAVTLLAVSPLAFAGGKGDGGHEHGGKTVNANANGDKSVGLINVADNNLNAPIQACNNDVPIQGGAAQGQVPVKDITAAASGALALLGKADSSVDQATDNSRSCGDNSGSAGDLHKQ